jgi:hypothetical protein
MAIAIDGASQLRANPCRCSALLDGISLGPDTDRFDIVSERVETLSHLSLAWPLSR